MIDLGKAVEIASKAAVRAGEFIISKKETDFKVEIKEGAPSKAASVVTEIDRQAELLILESLQEATSKYDIGVLGEEGGDDGSRFSKECFWCIDPIDGTLAFIEGRPGSAVSIGLVRRDGTPLMGIVYDLDTKDIYRAALGSGAYCNDGKIRIIKDPTFTWFVDKDKMRGPRFPEIKSRFEEYFSKKQHTLQIKKASAGAVMNVCYALQDSNPAYFKLPKKSDGGGSVWDYAATACIFAEAGGLVSDIFGKTVNLNPKNTTFMNEKGILYCSNQEWEHAIQHLTSLL